MPLYVDPLSGPRGLGVPLTPNSHKELALKELDHLFAYQLLQEMRKSVPKDGLLSGGHEQRLFEDMLDDALAKSVADSGQLGIARQIEQQLDVPQASRP